MGVNRAARRQSGVVATYHGGAFGAAFPPPAAFTARTLNRYSVPLVSPVTTWDVVDAPLLGIAVHSPQATPAHRTWYSYRVMLESDGLFHERVTILLPPLAVSPVGAAGGAGVGVGVSTGVGVAVGAGVGVAVAGGVCGVAATYHGEALGEGLLAPAAFTARTLNRYSVPLFRFETTCDVVDPPPGMTVHAPQATPACRV